MDTLTLEAPWLLLLLPLLALGVALSWSRGRRADGGYRALASRSAALFLLIVALAQPQWGHNGPPAAPVVFLVDTSRSTAGPLRAATQNWLRAAIAALPSAAVRGLITFATEPQRQPLPGQASALTREPETAAGATDIQRGLTMAVGLVGRGGRVVLLSDGQQTQGDALASVAAARTAGVAIDVGVPAAPARPDVAVTRLQVPHAVHLGDAIPALLTIRSTVTRTATIAMAEDGRSIGQQKVLLQSGDNPFLVTLQPSTVGWHGYRALVTMTGDAVPQNNALDAITEVIGPPRLLVVTAAGAQPGPLVPMLTTLGFAVDTIAPAQLPRRSEGFQRDDGVVLNDIAATALGGAQVAALESAVRRTGLGLLVLGGSHSLTLGHYSQTALERLLPVLSVTPSSLDQGVIALQLVLDRSGSMQDLAGGNVPKIEMSQAAADIAADFVAQHKDDLGIVSFDLVSHILVPMQRLAGAASNARVHRIVSGMTADGGTDIYDALRTGLLQALNSAAPYRHIILMTDGVSAPANYSPLVRLMTDRHITLSTIGLGTDADVSLLKQLARDGKGRFYYTNDGAALPHIFAEEARLSAGTASIRGRIPVRLNASTPAIRALSGGPLDPVSGYVATVLRPGAVADLVAPAQGHSVDPLLAQWQYGLGRVLVWTPGASASWAGRWMTQTALWQNALRWMARGIVQPLLTAQLVAGSAPPEVEVDTLGDNGSTVDLAQLSGTVATPDGLHRHFVLVQSGPGQYSAALPDTRAGIYHLTIQDAAAPHASSTTTLAVPYDPEYLPRPPNWTLLSALAAQSGGRIVAQPRSLASRPVAAVVLWWPLVAVGLLLFLIDVVVRLIAPQRQPRHAVVQSNPTG